jgi:hypothetical protein
VLHAHFDPYYFIVSTLAPPTARAAADKRCSLGLRIMALTLIGFDNPPSRFAATKTGTTVPDGRFFLDFTRRLEVIRWFGVRNRYIGPAVGLLVPVVHEAQKSGGYVIGVDISDAYFRDLRKLWNERFPSRSVAVPEEADGLKIIADFATQFPDDCRPPTESLLIKS